ncbi:MAG: RluA family pseudouridine synthase [Erysipelotrichaceae bacterium]|nr:RluA family pseudouridine synthase [Erysipelotrichaceae bacterium]
MRELMISENDSGQRVDRFLTKALPLLPKSLLYKYIRNKKIKVNGHRCEIAQRLQNGDRIQCYIKEEFFAQGRKDTTFLQIHAALQTLYEDAQILIAFKPAGILSQKDQSGIQDNMNDRLLHHLYDQHEYDPLQEQSFVPAFAHRLDRNTEGLMIAGKSAQALRSLYTLFQTHALDKRYLALVQGHMDQTQGDIRLYYQKDHQRNHTHLYEAYAEGRTLVHSAYQVKERFVHCDLVEVILHTGKSHQIRASLAYLGHPLLGDRKYQGIDSWQKPHQALCAYQLQFPQGDLGCLQHLAGKCFTLTQGEVLAYIEKLQMQERQDKGI